MANYDNSSVSQKKNNPTLTIYRKKSTFKGATDKDFWYSATLSKETSLKLSEGTNEKINIVCKFGNELKVPDLPAFAISGVIGNIKHKPLNDDNGNLLYDNYIYYIEKCDFTKIPTEPLPL